MSGWAAVGDEEYMRIMIMDARYLPRYERVGGVGGLATAFPATE